MLEVGERSAIGRSFDVSQDGRSGSENVGISNENSGGNPERRKSKVSWGRVVLPGLADPKLSPDISGVSDGEPVNIPVPPIMLNQRTQEDISSAHWIAVSSIYR